MANASHQIRRWAPVLMLTLMLIACGGGEDGGGAGSAGAPRSSAVIGPAGGTLLGPNGSKVVIPPGALSADAVIGIEQTSAGAPALPAGFAAFGQMFAFTPHGTAFAVPVTITLPFDAAAAPAGSAPALYKTNAQNQWEQLTNAKLGVDGLSAEVTSFSYGIEKLRAPERFWLVEDYLRNGDAIEPPHDIDTQNEFAVLEKPYDFGPARLLDPSAPGPEILPREFRATGRIFASAGGGTYSVSGEAPISASRDRPSGNFVFLKQIQSYIKREENARLTLKVTEVRIEALDAGSDSLVPCVLNNSNPWGWLCDRPMQSHVYFSVTAYPGTVNSGSNAFFRGVGFADLRGWRNHWDLIAPDLPTASTRSLWDPGAFNLQKDVDGTGMRAKISLKASLPIEVDLSTIGKDQAFTLDVSAQTFVQNLRNSEFSYLGAFFRDPQRIDGDVQVITEGLEPMDTLAAEPRAVDPTLPAGCAPGASPGTLQFISPETSIGEAVGEAGPMLFVARTGGSAGEVTATVSTSDGTATAGGDYQSVNASVTFADGDLAPRAIAVPLLYSPEAEPNKTFNVTLSAPTGCASLGLSTTRVTILDDTRPLPTSFTLGGKVTGLAGSGLVLTNGGLDLPIASDGPFAFALPVANGVPYEVLVETQPTNPGQVCTVSNGSGTIAGAAVDNVAVNCVTPSATDGLDPTFGVAGKVTTGLSGGATSMALQSDGKLLLLGKRTLVRFNPSGSVDTSFGTAGQVPIVFNGGVQDAAQGLALQADGKIVVVGFTRVGTSDDFAVARYDASGALDPSFGTGGKVSADFSGLPDRAWAALIQPNGSIVVAGHALISTPGQGDNDFAVARFSSSGVLDPSFGTGGKVTTNVKDRTDLAFAAALQQDGKIVLTGGVGLVRYTSAGGLDPTFGTGGIARLDAIGSTIVVAEDLAIQSDGKIVVAGHAGVGTDIGFALARFTASGAADNEFGTGGVVTTTFTTQDDYGRGVALQGDGKIVVIGQSSNLSKPDFAVARFTAAGTPDASFGTGGKLTVDFFGSGDDAQDVAIQADGKIVVSGTAANGTSLGVGLVRINP
jgi:uncharacterized delta-60 repeat protein